MSPEDFRALLARNGGVVGHRVLDTSKDEEIAGVKTGQQVPPASVRITYTTRNGEITARQNDDGSFEILDDPKGLLKGADATSSRDAAVAETARHNKVTEAQAANANTRADRRTGQQQTTEDRRVSLAERAQDAEDYWRTLNAQVAAQKMSLEERNQKFKEYQQSVENQIAQQHLAVAQQAEARQGEASRASIANQGRVTGVNEATFGRDVGRDAVSNADKRYGYQREAAYARARASGKSPLDAINESAQTDIPDFDQIAEAAAQRAVQNLRGLPGGAPAPVAGAAPPPPVGASAGGAPSAVLAAQRLGSAQAAGSMAPPPAQAAAPTPYPQPGDPGYRGQY